MAAVCSPVYPEEEAEDENVIDDSGAAELTLDKIEDDTILVILFTMLLSVVLTWCKPFATVFTTTVADYLFIFKIVP